MMGRHWRILIQGLTKSVVDFEKVVLSAERIDCSGTKMEEGRPVGRQLNNLGERCWCVGPRRW